MFKDDTTVYSSLANLVRSESNFSTASSTAPYVAIVADVTDTICEFGLRAYLTRGVKLYS